jgi:hypothetical protein
MPTIASRVSASVGERIGERVGQPVSGVVQHNSPGNNSLSTLSPIGNIAPNRGIVPIQYMYDFDINRLFPASPTFVRGFLGIRALTQNLALQANTK